MATSTYSTPRSHCIGNVNLLDVDVPQSDAIGAERIPSSDIRGTAKVPSTGKLDGQEVVQVYVQDVLASVAVSKMSLKRFQKVTIKAGRMETVSILGNTSQLGNWNLNLQRWPNTMTW